ncbi:hypothetical protein GN244_ATG14462 [Phytophthora infestans]|uniref:Centrosomal protein POC5 n=1 Tax=Phytophthora infestans TaxID=4787 RepID=A0A833T4E6_PHYIN|nr:hypothetical protein GN244_ATG14462 [Phytophthora infestans]
MKSEAELSDKEWRQMRRQMSKLDFEPVPETPALLSRSLFGESGQELASIYEEKPEMIRESAPACHCQSSPKNRSSAELPSTSVAVSPKITKRYHPQEQKRPPESTFELDDSELAALDAQMAAAQDATRRLVMGAFLNLKAKKAKTEALERMKLSAAHASDIEILQVVSSAAFITVEELKVKVAKAEEQRDQSIKLLDRFSEFNVKQSRLNQARSVERSVAACFHAWNEMARQRTAKYTALRHVLAQACKRQQLASFRFWKESAQMFLLQRQLQDQRDRFENRILEMAKEYQLQIQQLQHDIDEAKCQVDESQKCRRKLEEDLRLVFLRGVSAMNIEALNVFGTSHKQLRKLGEQERSVLPARQKESNSNQIIESVKTNAVSSRELTVPVVIASSKELLSPETSASDPVPVEDSNTVCSSPSHSRASTMRSISTQAPASLNRPTSGCTHPTDTTGLRSAEMIQQHELSPSMWIHSAGRSASSTFRPSSAPLPTKKRSSTLLSAKTQVEMQYMRSTIAASAARATRPISASRSPTSTTCTAWALEDGRRFSYDNDGEEDGIDLEGYEEYLEHLKSKTAIRPCSARVVRPTTESSKFFTTNADNPVPTRPARPSSARPRMRSTPRSSLGDITPNGSQSRSSGMRRKRHSEKVVHARIRAVYNDVGRSSLSMKQTTAIATPYSTASALCSKSRDLEEADIHDEYYRLLDSEGELKAALIQEQQKRVKAVAHARRLEEVVAMKDKKIESLLHAKAVGADRSLRTNRSVSQRELAERDRQVHAITQRLKQKLVQQSQLLTSYEEAMQSLRSGVKSTNLMELEEERVQLYQELRHHQILLDQQRFEREAHEQKLAAFADVEARNNLQMAKLQQENRMITYEKRKLEQEIGFLKSHVEQIQSNLTLEQRKRTYDREFSESVGKHTMSPPTQKVILAQALDEMKKFVRRETLASIKREKLKSSRPATSKSIADAQSTLPTAFSAPKSRSFSTVTPRDLRRPIASTAPNTESEPSNGSYNSEGALIPSEDPTTTTLSGAIVTSTSKEEGNLEAQQQTHHNGFIADETTGGLVVEGCHESHAAATSSVDFANINSFQSHYAGKHELSSVEADPEKDQPSGGVRCVAVERVYNKTTDEELDEIQQQKLAAIESVLRLDTDDGSDSELLSIDMLDDAKHLTSDWKKTSIDEAADAALINVEVSKEVGGVEKETVAQEELQDDRGQSMDDLYTEDFLDTDVDA